MTWLTRQPIAHRGLRTDVIPENTLAAFERAMRAGHPIELDVHILSDGALVVFHDWTLERMTNDCGVVATMTAHDIGKVRFTHSTQRIPFLHEVLGHVDGRVPLLIECKSRRFRNQHFVKRFFALMDAYHGAYALSSFNPLFVRHAKSMRPHVMCGQNISETFFATGRFLRIKSMALRMFLRYCARSVDFVACHSSLLEHPVMRRYASTRTIPLLVWGAKQTYKKHRKHLYDNIIFD